MIERIRDLGLHILNGDIEEDWEGDFTYIGGGGRLTIDYALAN